MMDAFGLPGKEKSNRFLMVTGVGDDQEQGDGMERERVRERLLKLRSIWGMVWKQCIEDFLKSMRVILVRMFRNRG